MMKRRFLTAAALGGAALSLGTQAQTSGQAYGQAHGHAMGRAGPVRGRTPALLTVTGAIGAGNRGPLDPGLDQMMAKQKVQFDRAHAFDFGALVALPAVTIQPTVEYDLRVHRLSGPLLADVLKAAGASPAESAELKLHAVDGYTAAIRMADVRRYRFIVATHLDGQPMPLGGLGPLWAVYDADRFPEMAARKITERFTQCPWALYHLEVGRA